MARLFTAVLVCCGKAAALTRAASHPRVFSQSHRSVAMCADDADDEALQRLVDKAEARAAELLAQAAEDGETGLACSGGVITQELSAAEGVDPLTRRFKMKVKALQGEYSLTDENSDTERREGAITEGLIGFPCNLPMKVVADTPRTDDASPRSIGSGAQAVVDAIRAACEAHGMPANNLEVAPRLGGKVVSLSFVVRAESADAVSELREKLRADSSVRMVF
jgi:putative lipoic acid-binding regulatory protein